MLRHKVFVQEVLAEHASVAKIVQSPTTSKHLHHTFIKTVILTASFCTRGISWNF